MKGSILTSTPHRLVMGGAVLLALTAVFPFGWLAHQWPAFHTVLYFVLRGESAHVVGHFLLMSAVGTAVLLIFPALRHRPAHYLAIMLAFGMSQEILQLLSYKKRPFMGADLFDIVVDLIGATVIFALFRIVEARREDAHGTR